MTFPIIQAQDSRFILNSVFPLGHPSRALFTMFFVPSSFYPRYPPNPHSFFFTYATTLTYAFFFTACSISLLEFIYLTPCPEVQCHHEHPNTSKSKKHSCFQNVCQMKSYILAYIKFKYQGHISSPSGN